MRDIPIKERKIDSQWLKIGVQGDSGVERYRFVIERYTGNGTDLSEGMGTVVFRLPDGSEGVSKLEMEPVDEIHIGLIWEIGQEATAQPGTLEVALRISGLENRLWHSETGRFTVGKTIPVPSGQFTEIIPRKSARRAAASAETMEAFGMERIADPSRETPITIAERSVMIPAELQNIAVQNDQNSEEVSIVLPRYFDGFDLSRHDIYLRTLNEGGRDDILFTSANKTIVSNEIHLRWMLKPPQTSYSGKLTIQLMIKGQDFQWSSNSAVINIIKLIDGEPVVPVTPSVYETWMEEISALSADVKSSKEAAAASASAAAGSASAAKTSETNAAKSASSAKSDADKALEYRNQAESAKETAQTSAGQALESANSAFQSETAAENAKTAAETAKSAAQASASQASASATSADQSKTAAENAKKAAEAAKSAAQKSKEDTEEIAASIQSYTGLAKQYRDEAEVFKNQAGASASSASASKTAAETAKGLAETSANQAKRFSESSQTSAQSALQSAQDAAASEDAAAGYVEDAQGQAARAEQEADRAEEAADRAQNIADAEFINPHTLEIEPLQMILDETFNFLFDLIKKLHNLGVTWSQIMDKGLTWREIQEKGLSWREIGVAGITPENVTALRKALMGLRR